ncbi:hypothetical protein C8T65DRAFT_62611 [Cerioporus squamosus]|nr:hypothetical protein C8T65DRAFT_62611 [Cerioporus squamosus]
MDTSSKADTPCIEDITRTTLSQLQREAPSMSDDRIERCLEMLLKTVSDLREIANSRAPFCALPVEILDHIMEAITNPLEQSKELADFRPFWKSAARDNTMLVPITRTCRYLRTVALSNPLLWSTMITQSSFAFISQVRRSDGVPLAVVVTPSKEFTNILDAFYPSHAHHIRELHFTDIGHRHINYVQSLMKFSAPGLMSYAVCGRTGNLRKWPTHSLPLSSTSTAALRDLYISGVPLLPSSPLPQLTHVALCDIEMRDLHIAIANLLACCPSLESLVLSELDDGSVPEPQPLRIPMERLRRLTIHELTEAAVRFYLALLPITSSQSATQLLGNGPSASVVSRWLSDRASQPESTLAFTHMLPRWSSDWHYVALTVTSPDQVVHVLEEKTVISNGHDLWNWCAQIVTHSTALLGVREVWVTNVSRMRDDKFATLQSTIASLPALETLVLKDNRHAGHTTLSSPDLSMCPSALDPSFHSDRLKTLRVIYGLSPESSSTHSYVLYALSLADMFAQLRTGAYDYFEHLVVQLVRQLVINEADLSELREHFTTVQVQYVDGLPDLPLPAFCNESRAGPYGSRAQWVGALW